MSRSLARWGERTLEAAMCFYIQFIHSSIQYTETIIYRYIYRISYINLSLLFTAILVWIFHTLSKKKKKLMGGWHI